MPLTHLLILTTLALGQEAPKLPSAQDLLPLLPTLSTKHEAVRSFAFDIVHYTPVADASGKNATESLRTRGWYAGPNQFAVLMLDDADNTPLFYASDGKCLVYDVLEGRCFTVEYGSLNCYFLVQDKASLAMGTGMNVVKGGSRFDFDLRSLFKEDNLKVTAAGPGSYQLSARGEEATASILLSPKGIVPWGRFTLSSPKENGQDQTLLAIDLVDYNRAVGGERLAFPALNPVGNKLRLTAFPQNDTSFDEFWKAYLDGFKHKAPPEAQANFKEFDTPAMKALVLAQWVVRRSHFMRMGLRHPAFREKLKSAQGDVALLASDRKIDWDQLVARDKAISGALREVLAQQTPLRQPLPTPAEVASAHRAKTLFEAMERKLAQAKSFKVKFESEVLTTMSLGRIEGILMLAPGNRMNLSWSFSTPEQIRLAQAVQPESQAVLLSDGKNFVVTSDSKGKPTRVEAVKEKHQQTLSSWGFRIGLFYTSGRLNQVECEEDRNAIKLSDFKTAGEEEVDGRPANVIQFTLTKNNVPTFHKLWLDQETGLPLKLVVRTREGMGCSETYHNWQLDLALPDDAFTVPKGARTSDDSLTLKEHATSDTAERPRAKSR